MPSMRPSGRSARISSTSEPQSAKAASGSLGAIRLDRRAIRSPARSISAASMPIGVTCSPIAKPPSGFSVSSEGGCPRPALGRRALRTKPSSSSSRVIVVTVWTVSPTRAAISAREIGAPRRIVSSTIRRLYGRPLS